MAGQGRLVMGLIFRPKRQNLNRKFLLPAFGRWMDTNRQGLYLPQKGAKFLLRIGWGEGGRRPDEVNR
jgi:hypothetical protein